MRTRLLDAGPIALCVALLANGASVSVTPRGIYRIRLEVKRLQRPPAVGEFEYGVPG